MRDGVALLAWRADSFAYAESYDEAASRYRGLKAGQNVSIGNDDPWLIVKPDIAARQLEAEIESSRHVGSHLGLRIWNFATRKPLNLRIYTRENSHVGWLFPAA
jgi:hypothetical protein